MISVSIPIGMSQDLPRRDLRAIIPYLNRKEFDSKPQREQIKQVENILQKLAAASRMQ